MKDRNFFLKPGCSVSDFKVGDTVRPYKMDLTDVIMIVREVCYERDLVLTDCGLCWKPNDLWPLHYENDGAIYVDFDDTLAKYEGYSTSLGKPKKSVVSYVKHLLSLNYRVKLFTARVTWDHYNPDELRKWCYEHLGSELEITNVKYHDCIMIIDDRAFNVKEIEGIFGETGV